MKEFVHQKGNCRFTLAVLACLLAAESGLSWAKVGIEGSATQKLRVRTTGAMDDFDMETLLTASLFPENSSKWSGFVQMGEIYDLDSDSPDSPFGSVYDTFDNRAAFRLYSAYFDLKNTGFVANLRAGRQHRHEFESLYFDGMELKTKPASGFSVAAYAGVPVHLYENQFGLDSGDWLAGGALQWNPNGEFQARVDYVHLKDEWTGFRAAAGDLEDNLIGASFWWEVTRRISWEGKFTSFFDKVRDVSSKIAYNWSEKDFSVAVQFYRLLEGYGIRVTDWDAYGFLGNYQPYTEVNLTASKGLSSHFFIDGGFGLRLLDDEQIASAFNHGYTRFFLSTTAVDLPIKKMILTAAVDYYKGRDNILKNDNVGVSFDVSYPCWKERLKTSIGTAFYAYRYNLLDGNESDDVQTYYARITAKLAKRLEGRVGYELEDNDYNVFHRVDTRLTWNF